MAESLEASGSGGLSQRHMTLHTGVMRWQGCSKWSFLVSSTHNHGADTLICQQLHEYRMLLPSIDNVGS